VIQSLEIFVFCATLEQYSRNPVLQHFGILKPADNCKRKCDALWSLSDHFNIFLECHMHQEQYNKPLDRKSKDTLLENQVILSGLLLSNILLDFDFDLETAFWKIISIQILVKIITSGLLGCRNPLLPKFQSF